MYPPHCLRYFQEPQIVKATLPFGDEPLTLNSRVQLGKYPYFEGFFPPGRLPLLDMRLGGKAFVHCRTPVGVFVIQAVLVDILNERTLLFSFIESAPPVQKRQYFRVDTEVLVGYWKKMVAVPVSRPELKQVNLSGGGIRFPVPEPLQESHEVVLVIGLPQPNRLVRCEARLVRHVPLGTDEIHGAFQYTDIQPKDVDSITSFCLAEQRRLLREKVRV